MVKTKTAPTVSPHTNNERYYNEAYESCLVCPKKCGANRNAGKIGLCKESSDLRVAWAGLHFGEEPPVAGSGGSGTIFVTGCNLGCTFCQNYQIAHQGMGKTLNLTEFVELCFKLQENGAENVNIVTGSHAIPFLAEGLTAAKQQGLTIPVVWNSSAYESIEALELLRDCVDGWLPDLKTLNSDISTQLFATANYPTVATKAILWMVEHATLNINYNDPYPNGKMYSGVILRHLALPTRIADTRAVIQWFAQHVRGKGLLSLMTQYTPVKANPKAHGITAFDNRLLNRNEDSSLKKMLVKLDIEAGFYQEFCPDDSWLPDFSRVKTFSSELAKPLWHWTL